MGTFIFLRCSIQIKSTAKMVVSLADRKLFINRMDRQFEDNLRMRKNVNFLGSRANGMTKNLHLMQKDMRGTSELVFDMRSQARHNVRMIEEILNRPDMKKMME